MSLEFEPTGPWDAVFTSEFLSNANFPIRVSTVGSSGPIVQSLWFDFDGQSLWCATQTTSVLAKRLRLNNQIGFEVAGDHAPYHPELAEEVLRRLIVKYQGDDETELSRWLLSRIDREIAIKITALRLATWDFSGRMS